jgi:hypothetical protein
MSESIVKEELTLEEIKQDIESQVQEFKKNEGEQYSDEKLAIFLLDWAARTDTKNDSRYVDAIREYTNDLLLYGGREQRLQKEIATHRVRDNNVDSFLSERQEFARGWNEGVDALAATRG